MSAETQNMVSWNTWMHQADRQWEAARANEESGIHHVACFLYHQAAEMAVKAGLERAGVDEMGPALPPLVRMLVRARGEDVPDGLEDAAKRLNPLYIETRYPDKKKDVVPATLYGANESAQARTDVQAILDYVRSADHAAGR